MATECGVVIVGECGIELVISGALQTNTRHPPVPAKRDDAMLAGDQRVLPPCDSFLSLLEAAKAGVTNVEVIKALNRGVLAGIGEYTSDHVHAVVPRRSRSAGSCPCANTPAPAIIDSASPPLPYYPFSSWPSPLCIKR
ncbi:MAG: hypothetical protein LBK00_02865 [Treponema sp.]|nr:hypothetical protein [Treponema sp.]